MNFRVRYAADAEGDFSLVDAEHYSGAALRFAKARADTLQEHFHLIVSMENGVSPSPFFVDVDFLPRYYVSRGEKE